MATVKDNLIAAKALIDSPEKWGKGWPVAGGAMCIYMATTTSTEETADCGEAEDALRSVCVERVGHDRLSHFNDAPETTHADVMDLFDRAIAAQDGSP